MSASFTLKVLFPLLLFNFALEPALASDYSDGVDLFGKQKYREAAQLFEKAMQSKQIDANLCYYCAVSQQFSKNNARAKQMYQYVLSRFPGTQQATLAQKALDGYTKSAPRTSEASTAGDTTTDSVASAAKTGSNAPKTNFSSRETTGLIKIIKPLADRPAVDDSFAASVQEQLKNLPLPLIHLFREHGLKLCVTPTAIDYDPKMADKHPRGYENGRTFRNVPAFFHNPDLVVAEYAFTGIGKDESNLTHTDDPLGSMWHELGHAVDHVMGMLSKDPEYLRRYKKDLSNIDPEAYESLKYYTQGSGGPSETFAEMFCTIYGNRNTNSRNAKAEQLYNSFGSLASFIKGKVTELR